MDRVGISVYCVVCKMRKQPVGRSAPLEMMLCDDRCAGYRSEPLPGSLWPGERASDFGYPVGANGTRDIEEHPDE